MPTPTDGLLEITLKGSYFSQPWANVFHYWNLNNEPVTEMPLIADDFDLAVASQMTLFTSENVIFSEIVVKDVLGLNNDLIIAPDNTTGSQPGESVSAFTAMAFKLSVQDKTTKPGAKRIIGVSEANQAGGFLTAAALALAAAFEANLVTAITNSTQTYQPVVKGGPTNDDPNRLVVNRIVGATAQQKLTSQVSRR